MWPALIFAASRTDNVIGRTIILIVSIIIKNGFSHIGAPLGRSMPINDLVLLLILDKINLSHMGSPRINVRVKCLEFLNT